MPQRTGQNRDQTEVFCLEQQIASDNEVRLVDAFVDSLDLSGMGFALKGDTHTGRPAYSAGLLLKIYLYGYLNRIRSSRKLARVCQTNVELW